MNCPGFAHFRYNAEDRKATLIKVSHVSNSQGPKAKKPHGEKLCDIGAEFMEYMRSTEIKVVARERAISKFAAETQVINKVVGVMDVMLFFLRKKEFQEMTVQRIRKNISGKGNISKQDILPYLDLYFDHPEFKNLDESDACAVAIGWLIANGYIDQIVVEKEEDT